MEKEDLLSDDFLKQFKSGEELNDFLKQIQKRGIEKMLEGELDSHLGYDKHQKSDNPNARNGFTEKKLRTSLGESKIQVPRDRDASFNPMIVPKRGNMVDGIENVIVSLYAKGMSNSDIEEQIREVYGFDVSTSTISRITDTITDDIVAWQNRPLEPVYLIVWMDGIVFKVRENSKVINKTIYMAVGLRRDGKKEVLGLWLGKNESAAFWMGVLTDMRARGVEDILITATDNLNGFTDTIRNVFPQSKTQICVVHQIRNASRYVVWNESKAEMFVHTPIPDGKKEITSPWGFPDELKSWTWPGQEGKKLQVHVYTKYPLVKHELNGKIVGEQKVDIEKTITVAFEVPYESGKLTAHCFENNKEVYNQSLNTVGKPASIKLTADRSTILADRNDLSYVAVEILDEQGNLVPNDDRLIQFTLSGNAEVAGVGNGNPNDISSFRQPSKSTYLGKGLVIVRPKGAAGKITLTAKSDGLNDVNIELITQ